MGNTNETPSSPRKGEDLVRGLITRFKSASSSIPTLPTSLFLHPRCVVAGGFSGEFTASTTISPSVKVALGERCVLDSIAKSVIPGLGVAASAYISTVLYPLRNESSSSSSVINWVCWFML